MTVTEATPAVSRAGLFVLLERRRSELQSFIARRVPSSVDPDDVLQEALLHAARGIASLRDEERLVPWFYRIVRRVIADSYAPVRRLELEGRDLLRLWVERTSPAAPQNQQGALPRKRPLRARGPAVTSAGTRASACRSALCRQVDRTCRCLGSIPRTSPSAARPASEGGLFRSRGPTRPKRARARVLR